MVLILSNNRWLHFGIDLDLLELNSQADTINLEW